MTNLLTSAAIALAITSPGRNVLTWDTNTIGSPVNVYRAEHLGIAAGTVFALPALPPGTIVIAIGHGVVVPRTNWVTLTNVVTVTNTVTVTNAVSQPHKRR